MSEQLTNDFVSALATLEATRDAGPLTALYSSEAKSGNLIAPDQVEGTDGRFSSGRNTEARSWR